jgi:hypothetical protein
MALKIFFDEDNYYNATQSFQLQQIPYDTVEVDGSYVTIRPMAYGENLLQVLFEDKHGAKKSLEFAEQFEIAHAFIKLFPILHPRSKKSKNVMRDYPLKQAIIIR